MLLTTMRMLMMELKISAAVSVSEQDTTKYKVDDNDNKGIDCADITHQ